MSLCNIMGFRFIDLAFRFSLAENTSLSAWVSKVQHEFRCSRVCGADVSFRDVKWRHVPELSELSFCLRGRMLTFGARRGLAAGAHVVGSRWKSQHRKIVYLSPYFWKPFNSKVIKNFVPELRSRKCFCVSGFLCYLCMCVMDIMNVLRSGMNMSISHIPV